ncbi:hypothetical protein D910_02970 [Dendroctonus ponderosae]
MNTIHVFYGNNNFSTINQILTALRFYACDAHQNCIADFMGIHQTTASKVIKNVSNAIADLRPRYVKMPSNDEIYRTQNGLFQIARFPRVIGCIDGTHIRISSPGNSGYGLKSYLLTPLLNPGNESQRLYNECHIRTRNCVERTIGVWKRRFPVLAYGLTCKLETSLTVIVATAVLHNIAQEMKEADPPSPENLSMDEFHYFLECGNTVKC